MLFPKLSIKSKMKYVQSKITKTSCCGKFAVYATTAKMQEIITGMGFNYLLEILNMNLIFH